MTKNAVISHAPVVIVGGGLSGLVLAKLLARNGYKVMVIEKRPDPRDLTHYQDHRSINLTLSPRGLNVLAQIDLDKKVRKAAVPVTERLVHREQGVPLHQSYGGDSELCLWAIKRQDLHRVLAEGAAQEESITLLFESKFVQYDKRQNILTYQKSGTHESVTISPLFCVGADGAFSPLRQQLLKKELANYSQEFFSWSYKQFNISAELALQKDLQTSSVHVWPRKDALLIAIGNTDGSFNANLFLKRDDGLTFNSFSTVNEWKHLINSAFIELSDRKGEIAEQLFSNPESGILRNEVSPWFYKDRAVLIGDACHATYHFFAQGLNASLEDCSELVRMLKKNRNRQIAFTEYQMKRKKNTDAISRLSERNFDTLKNSVGTSSYHVHHKIDQMIHKILGRLWEPMYMMVAEGRFGYAEAEKRNLMQAKLRRFSGLILLEWVIAGISKVAERMFTAPEIQIAAVVHPFPKNAARKRNHSYGMTASTFLRMFFILGIVLGSPALAAKKLTIGLASTLADVGSNSSIPHGDFFRRGINLALEHQKKELAKKNLEINIQEFDYGNSRMQVLQIAKEAVQSKAVAVIGYNFSDHALLAAPIHQEASLAMITPTATADRIATMGPFVHQMSFSNSFQAELLAKLASENLNAKRVAAIVAQDCTYCRDLEADFKKAFLNQKGHEFVTIPVLKGDSDFEEAVKKYQASHEKFDLILIPDHELTSAKIILAFLKAGITGPFLGGDGWANYGGRTFQSMFSDKNFKAYAIAHWHEKMNNPLSNRFLADYEKSYSSTPNMTAAMAYDSMRYVIQGILSCNEFSRKAIEGCLAKIENFEGTTGHYRFRKNQSPEKALVLQEFRKNQFEFLKVVTP